MNLIFSLKNKINSTYDPKKAQKGIYKLGLLGLKFYQKPYCTKFGKIGRPQKN